MSNDDSQPRRFEPYTYISSAPNTQASNGAIGDGDGNGLFDPGNTPPLIFAFIALGFTLFGLIITVIYKRCRPLQNSPEPHHRHSTRCSVQKPKLWDVWMPADQYALAEERTKNVNDWDTFMPLSASLVYPYSPPPPVCVPSQYIQGHLTRPIPWENPERRLVFRQPPADTTLHVAVILSMPKPRQRQVPSLNETHPENEFHVGVTEVKWAG